MSSSEENKEEITTFTADQHEKKIRKKERRNEGWVLAEIGGRREGKEGMSQGRSEV